MKAGYYEQYGSPDVLFIKEVNKPVPGEDEVLVKVMSSSMNRTDCGFRKPEYPVIIRLINGLIRPRKRILGSEFSGTVESIGAKVSKFKIGDAVFGLKMDVFGCHAEYLTISENSTIALKPSNISFEEAGAVCDGFMLANTYLKKINRGVKILINGASGSIGSAGVQLAQYYGAEITAVCKTEAIDIIRSLGVTDIIDYKKDDFKKTKKKYDIIFDAVGKSSYFKCNHLMNKHGIYYSTELGFLAQNVFLAPLMALGNGRKIRFPIPTCSQADIEFFKNLIEEGHYKPIIDRIFGFQDIVKAAYYVESCEKIGNVSLKIK